ncbi:MAG: hypothetical protein NT145_04710, partial [Elusimicrobia bacterium]|nr:hypothetical protein [Elusimicrobiota bacterium]
MYPAYFQSLSGQSVSLYSEKACVPAGKANKKLPLIEFFYSISDLLFVLFLIVPLHFFLSLH